MCIHLLRSSRLHRTFQDSIFFLESKTRFSLSFFALQPSRQLKKPENATTNSRIRTSLRKEKERERKKKRETRLNHRRSVAKARFPRLVLPINARVSLIGRLAATDLCMISTSEQLCVPPSPYLSFSLPFPFFHPFSSLFRRQDNSQSPWTFFPEIYNGKLRILASASLLSSGRGLRDAHATRWSSQVRLATCIFAWMRARVARTRVPKRAAA